MADPAPSILPSKIGQSTPVGKESIFPVGFLDGVCEAFGVLLEKQTRSLITVTLDGVHQTTPETFVKEYEDPPLGAILSLNGRENAACACLDGDLVFHMVDIMFGGDANADETRSLRPFSFIDRECAQNIGDDLAASFTKVFSTAVPGVSVPDSACTSIASDMEKVTIVPKNGETFGIDLSVKIGKGNRLGKLKLFIGMKTLETIFHGSQKGSELRPSPQDPWFQHMTDTVLEVELELQAILHEEEMSVAALSRLDVGDIIPLPENVTHHSKLLLNGDDEIVSRGELGASAGRRAVRLSDAPDPKFLEPLKKLLSKDQPS